MKNVSLKFNFKDLVPLLLSKFSLILWIFLAIVILVEGWVIKSSVDKVLAANDLSQFAGAQLTRVSFDVYDQIEKRLTENSSFLPSQPTTADPFGRAPLE